MVLLRLDPKQIVAIRELIRELGRKHTLLLSTHILPEVKATELALARQIISQITVATFDNKKYKDDVKARMLELIQGKIDGQEITAAPEAPQGKIIDLMEALKASLGMAAPAAQPAKAADAAPVEAVDAKKKSRKKSA